MLKNSNSSFSNHAATPCGVVFLSRCLLVIIAMSSLSCHLQHKQKEQIPSDQTFEPTWESLKQYPDSTSNKSL